MNDDMNQRPPSEHDGLLDVEESVSRIVLDACDDPSGVYPAGTFRTVVSAMMTVLTLMGLSYALPMLADQGLLADGSLVALARDARPWKPNDPVPFWNLVGRELLGEGADVEAGAAEVNEFAALAAAEVAAESETPTEPQPEVEPPDPIDLIPAYRPHADDAVAVEQAIENVDALKPFFAALTRTELRFRGAITRATHYGDSAIGNDGITAAIRHKLQARFGDAGHGFHLLGQPNMSYRHRDVDFEVKSKFSQCFIIQGCRPDGHYGLGGTTFYSTGGAEITLGTSRKGTFGRNVSHLEVWYAGTPRGGNLRVKIDRDDPIVVPTRAEQLEDRWFAIDVPEGPHKISLRAAGGGRVRAYGVVLERNTPGVVWDGMSQIGAFTRRMLNFDETHFQSQLRHRQTNLVVLMFGGNDMHAGLKLDVYKNEYTALLKRVRATRPHLACLVMAPLDHGQHDGSRIVTRPVVPKLVEAQREVALANGCGFWDSYQAMGGPGSMGRWARSNPRLGSPDLAHLTHHGHKVIGAMLYRALMAGYIEFRHSVANQPQSQLEELAGPLPQRYPPTQVPSKTPAPAPADTDVLDSDGAAGADGSTTEDTTDTEDETQPSPSQDTETD